MADETDEWERNEYVVRGEQETMFPNLLSRHQFTLRGVPVGGMFCPPSEPFHVGRSILFWMPWDYDDQPFRGYRFTPFPKLYAIERKARHLATEGRERVTGAWKVLRGDRDPFDVGDEW